MWGLGELVPFAGMAVGVFAIFLGYRVVMRRMDQHERGPLDAGASDEVRRLREEVQQLRALGDRVMDLEERMDFTERVLARGPEGPQLPEARH